MEKIVETRMGQYSNLKQQKQRKSFYLIRTVYLSALSQYSSLLLGALNKDMQKCDQCLSNWKCEEETATFIPLWYDCNRLPQ